MRNQLKATDLEVGDKVAQVFSGSYARPSVTILEVTRKTKTTITLGDTVYNVAKDGFIGGERGAGRRSGWEPTPWYLRPDDPEVARVRREISLRNLRHKTRRAIDTWSHFSSADNADAAAAALTKFAAWARASGVEQ